MSAPQNPLPAWRGFNLLYFFTSKSDCTPVEDDFRWIADWGFDFIRLPMCYTLWTEGNDPFSAREEVLARVDRAVDLGAKYGLHVCLNLHRGPGYSVNREREEPFNLWTDVRAREAFACQWQGFARRYRGIPSTRLSFNLLNEPNRPGEGGLTRENHAQVMRATVAAVREIDPERLVILDGLSWGNDALPELADLGVAQSCRGYAPMGVTHYMASWVKGEEFPAPVWPGGDSYGTPWDRPRLAEHYAPWRRLIEAGVGVHCGECGCFNRTPHAVVLAWFDDLLDILRANGIGFALWNFRGAFGILDSGRTDVAYEDWHGHRLDRALLERMQA